MVRYKNMSDLKNNLKNVSEEEMKNYLKGRDVANMGTITIEKESDWEKVYRYMDALKEGDEFYHPAGLKIQKNR